MLENQVFFKAAVRGSWAISRTRPVESMETEMLLLHPWQGCWGAGNPFYFITEGQTALGLGKDRNHETSPR